nr:glutamate receptor ionotropic, kainate 4-like [Procambarus clarkii]
MRAHYSIVVFEVSADGQDANLTQTQLTRVVGEARRVRQVSWCVTVVVVSDDLAFLATFAQWSLKDRLLVWSTRLLVVTRLPLHLLQVLHGLLSMTNSILLIIHESLINFRCVMYIQLPYSPREAQALKVASWTSHRGLALTSSLPLFPDKFSRLLQRPTLKLATEINSLNIMVTREKTKIRPEERLEFVGPLPDLVSYLATALNFSYMYLRPPDGSWGIKRVDGTWSGMMGMVIRQEVDVAVGLFGISGVRAEVVDFMEPILIEYIRMLGARGRPEVDPWGFLFPLEPVVWAAILAALLVLPLTAFLMSSCFSLRTVHQNKNFLTTSAYLRILLNQRDKKKLG